MKNTNEYFEKRRFERQFNISNSGLKIIDIMRSKLNDDDKKRINDSKENAMLNKPLYDLKDIKNRFCLSWNELREIVIKF